VLEERSPPVASTTLSGDNTVSKKILESCDHTK
jgi:hypothetical protein